MNIHVTDTGIVVNGDVDPNRLLARLELRQRLVDLLQRANILQLKRIAGTITAAALDAISDEGEQLFAEIELWKAYR